MKLSILLLILSCVLRVSAQQEVFTEDDLIAAIKKFHPVARQAAIDVDIAKAEILSGRGGFDPHLTSETARKEFGGITYYDHQVHEVRIPVPFGIDMFAGTEKITGSRVNPEETRGSITYMGVSIQPLQNFLIDRRRAALLQAKNFHLLAQTERRTAVNDLLREALYDYWDWWEKYHVRELVKAAILNAEKRLTLVKNAFRLGERPAIDTLEAYTQVQAFQIRLSEAYQELIKANLRLATFLWTENGGPADLPSNVIPQDFEGVKPFTLADILSLAAIHPELIKYDYILRGLQIDKKLAIQSLLPGLKLRYNQTGYDLPKTLNAPWFDNNYRFGVSFTLPLRLSEGRGDLQKAKLKIERTRLDLANKQVQLLAKVRRYYTEWQQTATQLSLQTGLLANIRSLQKGEEIRFDNGESSLFLINAREQKTIETEQKAVELKAKVQKAAVGVRWSAGILAL